MQFFWNKKKNNQPTKISEEDQLTTLKQVIAPFALPAIKLSETHSREGFSKIGSTPVVPPNFQWPQWKDTPLAFLMQLKLSEINPGGALPYLPTSGLLYFFYDQEQSTWGFDPADRGSWQVLYYPETDAETQSLHTTRYPAGLTIRYKEKMLVPQSITTYPPGEDEKIESLNLTNTQDDIFADYRTSFFDNAPLHQLGGYPHPIQSAAMDVDCELASNGIYIGDSTGYNTPRAKELRNNKDQWLLLLQIDTDDDAQMMWGDCGTLYFWIKREDLARLDFTNVWMILQCG